MKLSQTNKNLKKADNFGLGFGDDDFDAPSLCSTR